MRKSGMTVRELVQWLSTFKDQDAEVEVIRHNRSTSCYDQGGSINVVAFDPDKHTTYLDLRGNPFVKPDAPFYGKRTLLLGETDA
jgi:hypothetical protein